MKLIFLLFLLFSSSFAGYEEIKIGKIDKRYEDRISAKHLKSILDEIETHFESKLGMNIFDYSAYGKPIDILYVKPSVLERRINRTVKRLKRKKQKIEKIKSSFEPKEKVLTTLTTKYQKKKKVLDEITKNLNSYITKQNSRNDISKEEYKKIKTYIKTKKVVVNQKLKEVNRLNREIRTLTLKYNNKLHSYKTHVMLYNQLANNLENMNRRFTKVKGKAIGQKEITIKRFTLNGKKVEQREERNSMKKIEIYGFESISELKAVLAHELAHLVGLPHINEKGALMHPILQKNQIENLELTSADIKNFKENF